MLGKNNILKYCCFVTKNTQTSRIRARIHRETSGVAEKFKSRKNGTVPRNGDRCSFLGEESEFLGACQLTDGRKRLPVYPICDSNAIFKKLMEFRESSANVCAPCRYFVQMRDTLTYYTSSGAQRIETPCELVCVHNNSTHYTYGTLVDAARRRRASSGDLPLTSRTTTTTAPREDTILVRSISPSPRFSHRSRFNPGTKSHAGARTTSPCIQPERKILPKCDENARSDRTDWVETVSKVVLK